MKKKIFRYLYLTFCFLFIITSISLLQYMTYAEGQNNDQIDYSLSVKREISKDIMMLEKKRYIEAKKKYQNALENQQASLKSLLELKNDFISCNAGKIKKIECYEINLAYKAKAREILIATLSILENSINMAKARIITNEYMTASKSFELENILNQNLESIEQMKNKVDLITESTSYESIKLLRDEVKVLILQAKGALKLAVSELVLTKMSGTIILLDHLSGKLHAHIEELEAKGLNVKTALQKIEEYDEDIEKIKKMLQQAENKIESGSIDNLNDAHRLLVNAFNELDNTYNLLKAVLAEIKNTEVGK